MKYVEHLKLWHSEEDAKVLSEHNELLDELLARLREHYRVGTASSDVSAMKIEKFWRLVRAGAHNIECMLIAQGLRP